MDTPTDSGGKLGDDGDLFPDIGQFQRLVGKLIYLTINQPDISYAVSLFSTFIHAPTVTHMYVVNRIFQYLKGSPGRGIWMRKHGQCSITAYTDFERLGAQLTEDLQQDIVTLLEVTQ